MTNTGCIQATTDEELGKIGPVPTGDLWIERSRSGGVAAIAERSRYLIAEKQEPNNV